MISVDHLGLQCVLFRFQQLVKVEIGDRTEKIGIGIADRVQFQCPARQAQYVMPLLLASRNLRQTKIGGQVSGIGARRPRTSIVSRGCLLPCLENLAEHDPAGDVLRVDIGGLVQVLLRLGQLIVLERRTSLFILFLSLGGNLQGGHTDTIGDSWKRLDGACLLVFGLGF